MKVTRKYIRNLVLEAMQDLIGEEPIDYRFFMKRIEDIASDTGTSDQIMVNNKVDFRFFYSNIVDMPDPLNDRTISYLLEIDGRLENGKPKVTYLLERSIEQKVRKERREEDLVYYDHDSFAKVEVKTQEDADTVYDLAYRMGNNDFEYFENLYKTFKDDKK